MEWPTLPTPSKAHWAALRRCIRMTFCTGVSKYQRSGGFKLDTPMGRWFDRRRNVHYECYVTPDLVLMRDEEGYHPCAPAGTPNFYDVNYMTTVVPPPVSHPVSCRLMNNNRIWMIRKCRHHRWRSTADQNECVEDTFTERKGASLHLVSDASVHIVNGRATGAWRLFEKHDERRRVVRTLEHQPHAHSHRHEMKRTTMRSSTRINC